MFLLTGGLFVVAATVFVYDYDFLNWIPAPIAAYINNRHYSLFPVFPWLAFMLFGGYFASGYNDAREQKKEKEFIVRFTLIGVFLLAVCLMGLELQTLIHSFSINFTANPLFFIERLAIVMVLLAACWFYADIRKTGKSVVLDVGRESLMVYTAHLLVIYGRFWNDRSPDFYYGGTFGVLECITGTLALIGTMIGAAIVWGWLKKDHGPLARVMFIMFMATVISVFLTRQM
jgi:uncharacterized membrane protein